MKDEKNQTIFQFIESRQVQALITALGLFALMGNIWIASKLAPLASDIDSLEARAESTDASLIRFVPREELNATFEPIKEDLKEIKSDVKDIRQLLAR